MPLVWSFTGHSARSRLLVRDLLCSTALPRAPYPCRNVSFVELSCACPSQACLGKGSVAVYKMAPKQKTRFHTAEMLSPMSSILRGRGCEAGRATPSVFQPTRVNVLGACRQCLLFCSRLYLCLSRACLDKMLVFEIHMAHTMVFSAPRASAHLLPSLHPGPRQ